MFFDVELSPDGKTLRVKALGDASFEEAERALARLRETLAEAGIAVEMEGAPENHRRMSAEAHARLHAGGGRH